MQRREGLKEAGFNALGRDNRANNRAAQYQLRTKQRMQLHQNGRNILISPQPTEVKLETASEENKENQTENIQQANKKSKHKEQYLQRFLAWKAQKHQQKNSKVGASATKLERHIYVLKATPKRHKPQATNVADSKMCKNLARKLDFKSNNLATQRNAPTISREKTVISVAKNTTKIKEEATNTTKTNILPNLVTKFDCKSAATTSEAGAAHKLRVLNQKQQQQHAKPTTSKTIINKNINKNKLSVPLKAKKPTVTSAESCIKHFNKQTAIKLSANNNKKPTTIIKTTSKLTNCVKPKPQLQAKVHKTHKNVPKLVCKTRLCVQNTEQLDLNTPMDVLRGSGRFDPAVTSTQQRNCMFDFEAATEDLAPLTNNMLPNKAKPRNLSRQYAVDIEFVRDDLPTDVTQQNSENESTMCANTFVSIARGKCSAQKERRRSTYLNSSATTESSKLAIAADKTVVSEETLQNKRTLEAVHYFRQQLQDEISRLHKLSAEWAAYREQHLQLLQSLNVDDMIDVAIGQTNLLTSKKFQQFNGLIARCEACASGANLQPDDGSEATKLITAIDLEGFWSMLQLQVDNIDKRFANLERWKANNWIDPDAEVAATVITKKKKVLTKKTAGKGIIKSKPTSALRDIIRKAQAEKRDKQQNTDIPNNSIKIFTPTRTRAHAANETDSGNRRQSIIVRDRKQFSQSPTILILPTITKTTPRSNQRKSLLRSALAGAANQSNRATPIKISENGTTPLRKSILKTPGTVYHSALKRNVSFGSSSFFKNIKFVTDSSTSDSETDNLM